jgi:hypothetical protein
MNELFDKEIQLCMSGVKGFPLHAMKILSDQLMKQDVHGEQA